MPQLVRPAKQTKIKVVPRDGELEITLNINISIDGQVAAVAENADVASIENIKEENTEPMVPEFLSGLKLKFGKEKE